MAQARNILPAFIRLTLITLIAGLALGVTYNLTKDPIAEQTALKAERARKAVFGAADEFIPVDIAEDAGIDWCYEALSGGARAGYVAQKTVKGYGGDMEIIAGVDTQLNITGVSAGGANFAETPGLGAKAKDTAFTAQFAGKLAGAEGGARLIRAGEAKGEDAVDAITSATITSRAVVNGVNDIGRYIEILMYPDRAGLEPSDAHTGASAKPDAPEASGDGGEG